MISIKLFIPYPLDWVFEDDQSGVLHLAMAWLLVEKLGMEPWDAHYGVELAWRNGSLSDAAMKKAVSTGKVPGYFTEPY